jgi:VWFA-related protein
MLRSRVSNRVRRACIIALCLAAAAPALSMQRKPGSATDGGLVELDIVVLDKHQQTVSDLRQDEFQIKENGRVVEIKTFEYVNTLGSLEPDDGRVVSLLMDDVGVNIAGTSPMQQIAHALLSPLGRGDELSVVRLSRDADEPFGDFTTARDRIAGYRGGMVPFSRRDTPETVLKAVTRISKQLEAVDHRRKAIICLGLSAVCDVEDPPLGTHSVLWPHWVGALVAAARANVSVYMVDPTGLNQRSGARGIGLVKLTGGERFANSNDFLRAADAIWRESSRYYLVGYWPPAGSRELQSIDVKVTRKDVHLRVRRSR